MTSQQIPLARGSDLRQKRNHYEEIAQTPTVQTADGLTILAGLYLALSPWIVGFAGSPAMAINNLVVGLTVAGLGIGCVLAYGRLHGVAWLTPVLGVWTIIAQWVMAGAVATTSVVISNVIIGAIVVLLGAGGLAMGLTRR